MPPAPVKLLDNNTLFCYSRDVMSKKKRTWHIWVQNLETGETRCKMTKAHSFGRAGWAAFEFSGDLKVKTNQMWDIMSVNDVGFSHDPKKPIT